jgi:hypothetical protein
MFKLLEEAWEITKKYKFLWIFGIFSTHLLPFSSGGFDKTLKNVFNMSWISQNFNLLSFANLSLLNLANVYSSLFTPDINQDVVNPLFYFSNILLTLGLLVLFIAFLLVVIYIISEIGLIWAVNKIKKGESTNFKETLKNSLRYFWRILFFNLFIMLCLLITMIPLFLFIKNDNPLGLKIYTLISFPLYVAFFIYLGIFRAIGSREIVINDISLLKGIKATDKIIRSNFKQTIKFSILYIILEMALTMFLLFIISLLIFPGLGLTLIQNSIIYLIAPLLILLAIILGIALKGAGATFISSWMTLVYLDYFRKETNEIQPPITDSQS